MKYESVVGCLKIFERKTEVVSKIYNCGITKDELD